MTGIDDNIIKSIIYGNQVSNRYGKFRAFCSPLSQEDQIDKMISYLRHQESFKKYNKIVYSYRLIYKPAFFVTQDNQDNIQPEGKLIEGFKEDQTLEGSGEKVLHLLQKFNVENVLIAVGIEQYDPLARFDQTNFRIIVERSKDLLNNLYTRVVKAEQDQNKFLQQSQKPNGYNFLQAGSKGKTIKKQELPVKKQNIEVPQIDTQKKFGNPLNKEYNRPNHIFSEGKPQFLNQKVLEPEKQKENQRKKQMMQLVEKVKEQGYQLEKITANMDARFFLQMKQSIQYDHNKMTEKILRMLMIIVELDTREQLLYEFNLQEGLQNMSVNELDDQKVKFINDMLRVDKYLTKDQLEQSGNVLKPLFEMISILVKSYENNKKLAQLEEEHYQFHNEMEQQEENDKFYSSSKDNQNIMYGTQFGQKQQQKQNTKNLDLNVNQVDEEFIMQILQEQNLKHMNKQQKLETLHLLNHFYVQKANSFEFHKNYWQKIGYKEKGSQGEKFNSKYYESAFLESTFGNDNEYFALELNQAYHCFENDEENYKPCYDCPKILKEYIEARKLIKLEQDIQ